MLIYDILMHADLYKVNFMLIYSILLLPNLCSVLMYANLSNFSVYCALIYAIFIDNKYHEYETNKSN